MGEAQKLRYRDPAQRRLYPIATVNAYCAQPMSAALAAMRVTPNGVSFLSLAVSLAGCVLLAWPHGWRLPAAAGLVHLGLLLDHADGQVARRTGRGSVWGMY
ncbi:MAG TPA: CDP-alcohol phosphatidyltransferase family protein, partial [Candidatus Thermoplasmatota archaeon]|nr:CDP-alcohol phosphatidyltransferase family protein [Candidatus Thermoplasmatota archaeon]